MRQIPYTKGVNKLPNTLRARLDSLMQEAAGDIFSAAGLTVIYHGKIVLDATWGWSDMDTNHAAPLDALFDLASLTKLFTTTAFLSLVSEGKVSLYTPLVEIIPEFGDESPRSIDGGQDPHTKQPLSTPPELADKTVDPSTVTLWHLLTHTAGLPPWRDVFRAAGPTPPPPDIPDLMHSREKRWQNAVNALCHYPFVGTPDDGIVRYSDIGLMLLGEAVSRLHGTPGKLDEAIKTRVLDPLNLDKIMFNPIREGHAEQTQIIPTEQETSWRKRRLRGEVHDENACGVGGVAGHAGLFAPGTQVAQFGQAWLSDPGVWQIDPDLAAQAKQEQARTGLERRGLGFSLRTEDSSAGDIFSMDSYGHTGFTGTSLWIDPEIDLVVALLTNRVYVGREKPGIHAFRRAVHDALAETFRGG